MRLNLRATLGALLLAAFAAVPAIAQTHAQSKLSIEQYLDWSDVQTPQLSPDGTQIIYTRRWIDKMNDKWETSLWMMNADGSHQRALVQGSDVRWSPDGKRIAYVAKGEAAGSQIWVRWMDAEGAASQISRLTETPAALEWAPDGKSIAFTMNVPVKQEWRIAMPAAPKGAKWIEPPKIVMRLDFRSDRIGYTDESYRHIFVISADGGTPRQVTSGDWNHSGPTFSADSKTIAFSSNRVEDAEHAFRESEIYAANIETRAITQLTHHAGPDNAPAYSPDGKLIAYMSGDSVDHSAWSESKITVMNTDGSNRRVITAGLDRPMAGIIWATDNSGVYFNVESEGSKNLYFASLSGQVKLVCVYEPASGAAAPEPGWPAPAGAASGEPG